MSVYSLQSLGLADSHPPTDSALPTHVPSLPGETRTQPTPRRSPEGPSISSGWDEQDAGFTLGGCRGRGDPEGAGLCVQPWSQAVPAELSTRPTRARRPPAVPEVRPRRSAPLRPARGGLSSGGVEGPGEHARGQCLLRGAPDKKGP